MTNFWWLVVVHIDIPSSLDYSLGAWCMSDDLPQFYVLPHEDIDVHIKIFLGYCIKNDILDPSLIVCIFPHTL